MDKNIIKSPYPDIDIPIVGVAEFVLKKFQEYANNVALICPVTDRRVTYVELVDNVHKMSTGLNNLGLKPKEVVCGFVPNCLEYIPFALSVLSLGGVVAGTNPTFTEGELLPYFNKCKVNYILTNDLTVPKILELKDRIPTLKKIINIGETNGDSVKVNPKEDVALYMSSSGTMGLPKVAVISHFNIVSSILQMDHYRATSGKFESFSSHPGDVLLSIFPFFHAGGLIFAGLCNLHKGVQLIVLPKYSEADFFRCIEKYRATILFIAPPLFFPLTGSPLSETTDTSCVKTILCGGAPTTANLLKLTAQKYNLKYITEGHGMTEMTTAITVMPVGDISSEKTRSCGAFLPNTMFKIVDYERTKTLGPNEPGEICVKGPQQFMGYLNDAEATNNLFDQDGWLMTGDVGYYDNDNFLYIVDRIKELIKVKAFQVAPAELEAILVTHPSVADAAVIGVPNDYAGELPFAFIVKRPDCQVDENEIKTFVADKVAAYKRLDGGVKFVDSIPRNTTGKILRRILRDEMKLQ